MLEEAPIMSPPATKRVSTTRKANARTGEEEDIRQCNGNNKISNKGLIATEKKDPVKLALIQTIITEASRLLNMQSALLNCCSRRWTMTTILHGLSPLEERHFDYW